MSQKISKRTKKLGEDEGNGKLKAVDNVKTKDEAVKQSKNKVDIINNGEGDEVKKSPKKDDQSGEINDSQLNVPKRNIQTRGRSVTPLTKVSDSINGVKDNEKTKDVAVEIKTDTQSPPRKESDIKDAVPSSPANSVEMDPLVLEKDDEEPIPELQFDENDVELESEGSNSRCKTRRSHSRNISTPKTPKIGEKDNEELEIIDLNDSRSGSITPKKNVWSTDTNIININLQPSDEIVDLNDTSDTFSSVSTENLSTKAVAGSDATRNNDLSAQDSGLFEDSNSNLSNRTFADTVKSLSGRRTIHSGRQGDYRRFVLKNSLDEKRDIYADYESVQNISMGLKRKSHSFSPISTKRVKKETSGFFSYLSNPISNFRFKKENSPQFVEKCGFDANEEFDKIKLENGIGDEQRKWCSIM